MIRPETKTAGSSNNNNNKPNDYPLAQLVAQKEENSLDGSLTRQSNFCVVLIDFLSTTSIMAHDRFFCGFDFGCSGERKTLDVLFFIAAQKYRYKGQEENSNSHQCA